MRGRPGRVHRIREIRWGTFWPVIWFTVWAGWLALEGCSAAEPPPTLVPTMVLPSPTATPSPIPTVANPTPTAFATNFPTWRTATIPDHQSFDFRQEITGPLTGGDLYYSAFSARQGTACFWADNVEQVGGRDLGSWSLSELTERRLPSDRLSGQCIPAMRGHIYVYGLNGDKRLAVFRVVDKGSDSVTVEYILRE
jgi:hypothetical protein